MRIIKVPFSEGSLGKNIGCKKAPDEIVRELEDVWSTEDYRTINFEVDEMKDFTDIKDGDIYLGGDHSITYHLFKDFSKKFNNPGLIVFDAHPDVFEEHKNVTHQDWLLFLVKENLIKKENIIVIATRNPDLTEIEFFKQNKIKFFSMKDIFNNIENTCDTIMELARNFDALYLSLDIDSTDPAFAPGTGYIEPGGLSSRELIYFVQRLKLLKNLKRVDLVEINPDNDINRMTIKLGAKLIGELF